MKRTTDVIQYINNNIMHPNDRYICTLLEDYLCSSYADSIADPTNISKGIIIQPAFKNVKVKSYITYPDKTMAYAHKTNRLIVIFDNNTEIEISLHKFKRFAKCAEKTKLRLKMDYTELKIGDLVECGLSQVARVQAITNEYVGVDTAINDYYTLPINKVKPIPLTEEILKRNGWQEEHKEWRKPFPYDIFILAPYINNKTQKQWWSVEAVMGSDRTAVHDIRYVHELQHIFWALGLNDKMEV